MRRVGSLARAAIALPLTLALVAPSACWAGGAPARSRASARPPRSAPLTLTVDAGHPGAIMPGDFVGLSFESPVLGYPVTASPASHLANLLRSGITSSWRV